MKSFTWSQRSPLVFCRLDLWLTSHHLQDEVEKVDIVPSIRTDHSAIVIVFSKVDSGIKGPSHWKFNNSLLKNEKFVKGVKERIKSVIENDSSNIEDKRVFWVWLKFNIKDWSIKFAKQLAKEVRSEETALENDFKAKQRDMESSQSEENYQRRRILSFLFLS